ncbi:ABC transporter substrate-binding protein [Roseomonas sp. KE2513]|uniref:ABC transporter substrate-binding protein n=1 Tax=Roseomonas sp. KE2513 TaxID=2479202 RepID=UPI0018E05CF6|nr:ABC transporter substrate-binding protein [Roseomonas sp. KE2513]
MLSLRAQSGFTDPTRIRIGVAPYISNGPYLIAEAKGYFRKLNLDVVPTVHVDGSLSMPSLVAGELDITGATMSAGLFNLMSKGAGIRLFMEAGREAPGMGSNAIMVSNELYDRGFRNQDGYRLVKGQTIAISSRGSVAHYLHTVGLERAGLSVNDVDWRWGMSPPTGLSLMSQGRVGLANVPLPGAYIAQNQGIGKVGTWSDEIAPNFVLACSAASERFLNERHNVAVRFGMAMLQARREYMEAARNGTPEIIEIIAKGTNLAPKVIDDSRPRWTEMSLDGQPYQQSVFEQQRFWNQKTDLLARTVPEDRMFDLRALTEAKKRLDDSNPFI